ncbi:ATP-dependent Clp protease adaptor ClpS [Helicobacter himalayensis]|uniref:ATP-dependent Clp protease adaptor ClpS n=1 Tax=Helicobacter himalayensis TaxID=1591088 RepID=UPI0008336755|nr:ATP-dependent Clp protease adaptor ClpS [Helicobacter himalayensis]
MPRSNTESATDLLLEEPKLHEVIILNDNWTTMEFVVDILIKIFDKNFNDAKNIMLRIHEEGLGVCGIYPYDIAELKVKLTLERARKEGHPLRMETREV